MKKSLVIFSTFSIVLLASMISSASASNGWVQSVHPPSVRHTATNPGNIKILEITFANHSKILKNYRK